VVKEGLSIPRFDLLPSISQKLKDVKLQALGI
jgi:hypothetical protein